MAFPTMPNPDDPGSGDGGGGAGGGTGSSTGTLIFDFDFTKDLADSLLKIIVYINVESPDDLQFTVFIILDGYIVQTGGKNIILDTQNSRGRDNSTPFVYLPGVAAGAHNCKISVRNTEVDNVNLRIFQGATLEITEYKQGGR